MDFRFFLNGIECEEPIGWADLELSMKRDDTYHGMQFEASTGSLEFFGTGAQYLIAQKEQYGILANVTFLAEANCGNDTWSEVMTGRLNFGKYKATCGATRCTVSVPVEEANCKVVFSNRFDQKVDVERTTGFDNMTALPVYAQLGQLITMPAVALDARVEGYVADNDISSQTSCDLPAGGIDTFHLRPMYKDEKFNAIATGQLNTGNECNFPFPITPQFLFEQQDTTDCFGDSFLLDARLKGNAFGIATLSGVFRSLSADVVLWDGVGTIGDGNNIFQEVIFDLPGHDMDTGPIPFDVNISLTIPVADLEAAPGLYVILTAETSSTTSGGDEVTVQAFFDVETFFRLSTKKVCPDTEVQYYMVHETLSRVTEAITNSCIRVKSSFYGRIDSQPFAFDGDGCGGLRMLTSGLKLRKAPDGKFFANMKDLLSGLNAIDNIGFDIIPDTDLPNRYVLRIEDVDEFYQDRQLMLLDYVALSSNEVQENLHYAKINVGYKKWETEELNGLNEFNSTREYRTNADTISTTLEITSNLVAGSIPIEVTRQQTFAESGAADTTYDNETFVVCLERSAYDFLVEQDHILDPLNIFDPATTLNYRLSPIRNLMRWFKSIVNTYANPNDSTSALFFNAGTGNFLAAGLLGDPTECRFEGWQLAENATVSLTTFQNQSHGVPRLKNEIDTFEYPLSVAQYNALKADPYGYIAYTCGVDPAVKKGYIKEIKYRPARGRASFILRKKWGA